MIHPRIAEINRYWATRLDCSPKVFEQFGTTIVPSEVMEKRDRIIVTRTSNHAIVQVPPKLLNYLKNVLDINQLITADNIMTSLKEIGIKFGWRDFIWYFPERVLPKSDPRVRLLAQDDEGILKDLMNACTEDEQDLANISLEQEFPLGLFESDRVLAAASFIYDGEAIADVGVITHPDYRGRSIGKSIVLELVRYGIEQGRIVQYTTQEQNIASKRLAESIGFWLYATEEGLVLKK